MALDEARLANDPGNQGAKLDWSIDYSQFGAYYGAKKNLPSAVAYQRKTLAIQRDLVASDPKDVWKQDRLAWTLSRTADLLIQTHENRAALADLDELKRIMERLGISGGDRMGVYAMTLRSPDRPIATPGMLPHLQRHTTSRPSLRVLVAGILSLKVAGNRASFFPVGFRPATVIRHMVEPATAAQRLHQQLARAEGGLRRH